MKSAATTLYEASLENQVRQRDTIIRKLIDQVERLLKTTSIDKERLQELVKKADEVNKHIQEIL